MTETQLWWCMCQEALDRKEERRRIKHYILAALFVLEPGNAKELADLWTEEEDISPADMKKLARVTADRLHAIRKSGGTAGADDETAGFLKDRQQTRAEDTGGLDIVEGAEDWMGEDQHG